MLGWSAASCAAQSIVWPASIWLTRTGMCVAVDGVVGQERQGELTALTGPQDARRAARGHGQDLGVLREVVRIVRGAEEDGRVGGRDVQERSDDVVVGRVGVGDDDRAGPAGANELRRGERDVERRRAGTATTWNVVGAVGDWDALLHAQRVVADGRAGQVEGGEDLAGVHEVDGRGVDRGAAEGQRGRGGRREVGAVDLDGDVAGVAAGIGARWRTRSGALVCVAVIVKPAVAAAPETLWARM